jgi:hypothetical protein
MSRSQSYPSLPFSLGLQLRNRNKVDVAFLTQKTAPANYRFGVLMILPRDGKGTTFAHFGGKSNITSVFGRGLSSGSAFLRVLLDAVN